MAVHRVMNKTNARKKAMKMRKKGLKATIDKTMKGWRVYTSRK